MFQYCSRSPCKIRVWLHRLATCFQDVLWWVLYKAENVLMGSSLRKKAMTEIMRHIHYEVCLCEGGGDQV